MKGMLMKLRIAIVFLTLSTPLHADGPTDMHGVNQAGDEVLVYEDGRIPPDGHTPRHTVEVKKRGGQKEKYEKQDCGIDVRSTREFFCDSQGNSPLAGARYAPKRALKKCRGTLIVCKSGCGSRAPLEMVVDPWECGGVNEYLDACDIANGTNGVLNSGVNIREKPDSAAHILLHLPKATKIKVVERRDECLVIDSEKGQWVKVKIMGGTPIRPGWIFDAYIDYPVEAQEGSPPELLN